MVDCTYWCNSLPIGQNHAALRSPARPLPSHVLTTTNAHWPVRPMHQLCVRLREDRLLVVSFVRDDIIFVDK